MNGSAPPTPMLLRGFVSHMVGGDASSGELWELLMLFELSLLSVLSDCLLFGKDGIDLVPYLFAYESQPASHSDALPGQFPS